MKNCISLYLLTFLTVFTACQNDTPVSIPEKIKAPVEATSASIKEIVKESNPLEKLPSTKDKSLESVSGEEQLVEKAPEKTKEEIASEKRRAKRRAKRKKEAAEAKERAKAELIREQEALRSQSNEGNTNEVVNFENPSVTKVLDTIAYEEPLIPAGPYGVLSFPVRSYDFGRIEEGDRFEHEFKFFNSGDAPIVISNVKASCGCTKTTYPKEPIMPGEEGMIGVTFESKGKLGRQKPFMSVVTNGFPLIYSLYMEGIVDTEKK